MIELLQPGEHVDITIRGARVSHRLRIGDRSRETTFIIGTDGGADQYLTLPDHPNVSVERRVPADGEPQPGDIWRDTTGERYFAYGDSNGGVAFCSAIKGYTRSWTHLHAGLCGPITLEYRPEPPAELVAAAVLTPDTEVLS